MSVENSNMEDINGCQHKMAEILHIGMRCFRSECRGLPGVQRTSWCECRGVRLRTCEATNCS